LLAALSCEGSEFNNDGSLRKGVLFSGSRLLVAGEAVFSEGLESYFEGYRCDSLVEGYDTYLTQFKNRLPVGSVYLAAESVIHYRGEKFLCGPKIDAAWGEMRTRIVFSPRSGESEYNPAQEPTCKKI
jgi:hypothetical protein